MTHGPGKDARRDGGKQVGRVPKHGVGTAPNRLGSCNAACGRYRRRHQNGSLGRGAGHPFAHLSVSSQGVMNRQTLDDIPSTRGTRQMGVNGSTDRHPRDQRASALGVSAAARPSACGACRFPVNERAAARSARGGGWRGGCPYPAASRVAA